MSWKIEPGSKGWDAINNLSPGEDRDSALASCKLWRAIKWKELGGGALEIDDLLEGTREHLIENTPLTNEDFGMAYERFRTLIK